MDLSWALPSTMLLVAAQGGIMLVDEFYFHRRRGLGRFESYGHPIDTMVFASPLLIPAFFNPERAALIAFAALAVVSTLLITKDEFVHAGSCQPGEHWLHALLFVLHAPVLIGVALVWISEASSPFLKVLPLTVGAWGLYQFIYWVVKPWRQSTMPSTTNSVTAGTTTTPMPSPSCGPNHA